MYTFKVISGLSLPKPDGDLKGEVVDPYVKVRIRGHPDDEKNKGKTEPVKNNGFNPVWQTEASNENKENFEFVVTVPELAFLDIKVKDHSQSGTDDDLGMFCCPLSSIQEGTYIFIRYFFRFKPVDSLF